MRATRRGRPRGRSPRGSARAPRPGAARYGTRPRACAPAVRAELGLVCTWSSAGWGRVGSRAPKGDPNPPPRRRTSGVRCDPYPPPHPNPAVPHAARGTCGTPEAGARTQHAQCDAQCLGPWGRAALRHARYAEGWHAWSSSPYAQYGGPGRMPTASPRSGPLSPYLPTSPYISHGPPSRAPARRHATAAGGLVASLGRGRR